MAPRSNLVILTGYQVTGVTWNSTNSTLGAVASGVTFQASSSSTAYHVNASKEVILSFVLCFSIHYFRNTRSLSIPSLYVVEAPLVVLRSCNCLESDRPPFSRVSTSMSFPTFPLDTIFRTTRVTQCTGPRHPTQLHGVLFETTPRSLRLNLSSTKMAITVRCGRM